MIFIKNPRFSWKFSKNPVLFASRILHKTRAGTAVFLLMLIILIEIILTCKDFKVSRLCKRLHFY